MRFNKRLARLESVNKIPYKSKSANALDVSDFIHYALENPEQYKLEGITKERFRIISDKTPEHAASMVRNLLIEQGHKIEYQSILEGIEVFKEDTED